MVVAGGVACNQILRDSLEQVTQDAGLQLVCPKPRLCTDNGVMVAWAGVERSAVIHALAACLALAYLTQTVRSGQMELGSTTSCIVLRHNSIVLVPSSCP